MKQFMTILSILMLLLLAGCNVPAVEGNQDQSKAESPVIPLLGQDELALQFAEAYNDSTNILMLSRVPESCNDLSFTNTIVINGPAGGQAILEFCLAIDEKMITTYLNFKWLEYQTKKGLILDGVLNSSFDTVNGGEINGTITCSGTAQFTAEISADISPAGSITGYFMINGVKYDIKTGKPI